MIRRDSIGGRRLGALRGAVALLAVLVCVPAGLEARQEGAAERAYLRAVARYFQMPESEVAILAHWDLSTDEIPVALFVARRAGVSAEALVALRESGRTWSSLAASYNVGATTMHVQLRDQSSAGVLSRAYESYRVTPVAEWSNIRLDDTEIVALINVRVLAESLRLAPDDVARHTGGSVSFVELYAQLLR